MGDWVEWSLPGEDGDHLGEPQHCHGMVPCLGGMPEFWLEKTPWLQQQGFGSDPKLLARTLQGCGVVRGTPPGSPGGHTAWQHQNLPAEHPPAQPPQKEHLSLSG